MVVMLSTLDIFAMSDLVAIAHESKTAKSRDKVSVSHTLTVWTRGVFTPAFIDVKDDDIGGLLAALGERYPWLLVDDIAEFKKRWFKDKDACAADADARRQAA
jgi:hypothetical protein